MSSPSKKIKITPKRLQGSQEPKITSTPQRQSKKSDSPNISRISSSFSVNSVRTRLSDVFSTNNHENILTSSSSNGNHLVERAESPARSTSTYKSASEKSVNSSDYDEYLDDCGRIKHTGNIWKIYKPLHEETLYAQLMNEPQNGQEVVTELLLLYNRKPEVAICTLLKLYVDICGYQNFNISEHYHFRENAANHIIKMMESENVLNNEALKSSGRYLLMESKTQLAKVLKVGIYNFLQKLIICGHERGILYDEFFAKHIFLFVKAMSFSEIRAIRHTGVVIAIKILTTLVMIYSKIINDENARSEEGRYSLSENIIQQQKQDINMFLEFFYFIFVKSCRLQDNKITLMRVECIHELSTWIKYFPKIFITQLQAVNCLCKLITDASKDVRYAALETFEGLIWGPNVLKTLKEFMPDFAEAVGKRFYDVDYKVAVKAIDIFTIFLKQDESLVTTHRFKLLTNLVFDNSYIIGEAAARFLTCYLQINEENERMVLIQLARFSMKPGYAIKELLVESCLHNCSTIQNWDIFIELLIEGSTDIDLTQALVEIFSESVYQTLEGHSTVMREMSPKVNNINVEDYRNITKHTPRLNTLLKKYKDHPIILVQLLKIICLASKDILNENHCQHYTQICETMEILFDYHKDEKLIVQLVETFNHFCNVAHFAVRAKSIADRVCSKYTNDMSAHHVVEEQTEIVMKVASLFANFNLTKYFTWETLFDNWSDDEWRTAYLVVCCKWYLIWSLKNITETNYPVKSELQKQFPVLNRTCSEYISTCFNMLQNLNGQHLHFEIYDALCQLHITYMKILEGPIKIFREFQDVKLFISDRQLQKLLVSFLDKHVICNTTMSLHEKRVYVVNYVDLVHYNVLPSEFLGYIFKYYYTYNKEFGPIIESSVESIATCADDNVLLMVIVYTITLVFENVLNKYGAVDFRTEEVKHIKLLVKQFLTLKMFRTPNRNFKKLLFFALNYAFRDESKYSFLYFAKYFVNLLMDDDRTEVIEFFKKKMPKGAEKNDTMLYVANYIKDFKYTAALKRRQSKQLTGTKKEAHSNLSVGRKVSKENHKNKEKKTTKKEQKVPKKKIYVGQVHKSMNEDSETEISDDLTIHDSESDDLEDVIRKDDV